MGDPVAVAQRLAEGGRVQELTRVDRVIGANRIFRLWTDGGTRIAKIYGTAARDRREHHALEALADIEGLPQVIDRGNDGETYWVVFVDGGRWNLGSLPENPGLARKGGEILRAVHQSAPNPVSNLARGIDQEWVAVDFVSTFRRLERFRSKVRIGADLLGAARGVRPPFASEPRVAHTNPTPENFLVDDAGEVTLINWEWATLAPPEWDLSKATWLTSLRSGPDAAQGLMDGYGRELDAVQLDRWIIYHAGMMLVYEAENTLRTDLSEFDYLTNELQRAVELQQRNLTFRSGWKSAKTRSPLGTLRPPSKGRGVGRSPGCRSIRRRSRGRVFPPGRGRTDR